MTNLDDKLREILFLAFESGVDAGRNYYMESEPHMKPLEEEAKIAQIKAAIAELVEGALPEKRTNMAAIRKRLGPYNYAHKEGYNQALKEIRNNLKAKGILNG